MNIDSKVSSKLIRELDWYLYRNLYNSINRKLKREFEENLKLILRGKIQDI